MIEALRLFRLPLQLALAVTAFLVAWMAVGVALFQPPYWAAYVLGLALYVLLCGWLSAAIRAADAPAIVYPAALLLCLPLLSQIFF